jgi:uncharacterized membrane protein
MTWLSTTVQWTGRNKAILVLALIILLGAVLRIYDLGSESIWLDEAESIYESTLGLIEISSHSNQPPLYFVILNWWINLWGTSEIALRSLSAIFGILAICITYFVGKDLFGHKVGLLGSFIAAISQFHIYHSQDARAYSLLLLLSLLAYLFFIKILKQDKIWYYPCYFLATLCLGYTHIYGLFILASQIFYFLLFWKRCRPQRIRLVSTFIVMLISLSPLAILLGPKVISMTGHGFWIPQPSLSNLFGTLFEYTSGFSIPQLSPDSTGSTFPTIGKYILLTIFLALALLNLFSLNKRKDKRITTKPHSIPKETTRKSGPESINELLLLVLWLCFPIVIPFVASQIITPFYMTRYTIGASPALYLLVAKGMNILGRKNLYSVLIAITILSFIGLHSYYVNTVKEQWREVADLVENKSNEGDVIVFYTWYVQRPFDYYYTGDLPEFGVPKNADAREIALSVENALQGKDRLWLIISNVSELPQLADYLKSKYALVDWSGFRGIVVFLFDLSKIAPK